MKSNLPSYAMVLASVLLFFNAVSLAQKGDGDFEHSVLTSIDDPKIEWGGCPPFMPEGCQIAVLHGDPAKRNSDILFKVNGKSDIPAHWHTSAERMILLRGEMEVTYEGEKSIRMKEGNFAYGPAKKPHKAKCVSKKPCVLYIAFEEPLDAHEITH